MKKKAIEAIPFIGSELREDYKYTVRAYRQQVKGEDHLFVEVYEGTGCIYRIAMSNTDWGSYDARENKWGRYKVSAIQAENAAGINKAYISEPEAAEVLRFCGIKGRPGWKMAITIFQDRIIRKRREKQTARRNMRLKDRKDHTPPLPDDLTAWADRRLFGSQHYLYYKRDGRHVDIACSACGSVSTAAWKRKDTFEGLFEHVIDPPRAGETGTCPYCGERGIWKPKGKTKGVWAVTRPCYVGQPYKNDGAVIRYLEIEKAYILDEAIADKGTVMIGAQERYIVNEVSRLYAEPGKKPQQDFHKFSPFAGNFWDDCNLEGMANISTKAGPVYYKTWDALKGTCLQYSGAQEFEADHMEIPLINYMIAYINHPQLEMISKMGLSEIAEEMARFHLGVVADIDADNPADFLGIKKERVRDLVRLKGDRRILKAMQRERRQQASWSAEVLNMMANIDAYNYSTALRYMSAGKLMRVLEKYSQVDLHTTERLCGRARETLNRYAGLYFDYLDMRIQRGYDLTNTVYLFPRDLQREHDRMVVEIDDQKMDDRQQAVEEKFPQIRKLYRSISNIYAAQAEGYIIRPAKSAGEIVREGRILHHCVGGDAYLQKHAEGKSYILFIRKTEDPDLPYITVEIRGTDIIQWYGAYDRKPDEDIIKKLLSDYVKALDERQQIRLRAV